MRFRLLPLAVAVAVLVAACGGSSTPTAKTTTSSHKAASHRSGGTQANTSTSSAASTPAVSTTSSQAKFASLSNCTNLSGVGEQYARAMSSASSGGKFNLSAMVNAYQNLANEAPSAIRSDVQVISSAFATYAADLQKAGYKFGTVPSASQISALESAAKSFDAPKLKSASKAIESWAVVNCK